MPSRYENRIIFTNGAPIYFHLLEERGLRYIQQYNTPILSKITQQQYNNLAVSTRIWTIGDRLFKVAAQSYGNSKLWWVIARFNNKPTDAHFKVGDKVYIPFPLEAVLSYYRN
jgi:hypothetical protein